MPGLSDIDLTVVIDADLKEETEFDFLNFFWRRFTILKVLFPMLGEVDILNDRSLETWTKFTIRGYESKNWKLVFGVNSLKKNYAVTEKKLENDSLNYALTNYLEYFLPKYYEEAKPGLLVLRELKRLKNKILRYLTKDHAKQNGSLSNTWLDNKDSMLYVVVKGLEESTKYFISLHKVSSVKKNSDGWIPNFDLNKKKLSSRQIHCAVLAGKNHSIKGIFLSDTGNFVVLEDNLNESAIKNSLKIIREVLPSKNQVPIIVTETTFNYILRFYTPYQYCSLIRAGKPMLGVEILEKMKLPEKYFYLKSLVENVTNIILFPQSQTLFSSHPSNRLFEINLFRALFVLLYLEKDFVNLGYTESLSECKKCYPDILERFSEIKKSAKKAENRTEAFELFRLFKGLENRIHGSLSSRDVMDNLFKVESAAPAAEAILF